LIRRHCNATGAANRRFFPGAACAAQWEQVALHTRSADREIYILIAGCAIHKTIFNNKYFEIVL
jgi:hypothetical protein